MFFNSIYLHPSIHPLTLLHIFVPFEEVNIIFLSFSLSFTACMHNIFPLFCRLKNTTKSLVSINFFLLYTHPNILLLFSCHLAEITSQWLHFSLLLFFSLFNHLHSLLLTLRYIDFRRSYERSIELSSALSRCHCERILDFSSLLSLRIN